MKLKRTLIACFVSLGVTLVPASASASDGFFGVMPQKGVSAADLEQMKAGGIESMRTAVPWESVEPARGYYNFSGLDELIANAARTGITVLPTLYASPSWLASSPRNLPNTPAELNDWNNMLGSLVNRYGSQGTFWSAHPSIPKAPITTWQIWNEENTTWFVKPVKPADYANLVIQSAATVRSRDSNARILLGGIYPTPSASQGVVLSSFLDGLYKVPGFGTSFDAAGIHPYATTIDKSMGSIRALRSRLDQSGDAAKGIYVDEIGWGSDSRSGLGQGSQQRQATQLTAAYKALLASRDSLDIRAVYWFTWQDAASREKTCNFCYGTGLFDSKGSPKLAWGALTAVINGQETLAAAPNPPAVNAGVKVGTVRRRCVVPRVKARRLRVARRMLRKAHCRVRVFRGARWSFRHRNPRITWQSKKPKSVWPAGRKIGIVAAGRWKR